MSGTIGPDRRIGASRLMRTSFCPTGNSSAPLVKSMSRRMPALLMRTLTRSNRSATQRASAAAAADDHLAGVLRERLGQGEPDAAAAGDQHRVAGAPHPRDPRGRHGG